MSYPALWLALESFLILIAAAAPKPITAILINGFLLLAAIFDVLVMGVEDFSLQSLGVDQLLYSSIFSYI